MNLALRQNPNVLQAKQEIERTRGVVIEVRAQALPKATVTSSYTQQDRNLLRDLGGASGQGQSAQATPSQADGCLITVRRQASRGDGSGRVNRPIPDAGSCR